MWAQGLETFDNFTYTALGYVDGSFEGENGITWNYVQSRGSTAGNDVFEIDGNGIMLRRSGEGSKIYSAPVSGGIGSFSVQMRKAHTSTGVRQVELFINGISKGVSIEFGDGTGGDDTVHTFQVSDINVEGDVVIEIQHITGGTNNRQLILDNITWSAYGDTPSVGFPTFSHQSGNYFDPISVTITSSTEGAQIYYTVNGEEPTQTSTLYTQAIPIEEDTVLKARAFKEDYLPSLVATANYVFLTAVDVPDLATLKASIQDETIYRVTGEVVLSFQQSFRNWKFVQDDSAGILIDDNSGVITTNYNVRDGITGLTGTISTYENMFQFVPVKDPGAASSHLNIIYPTVITIENFNNDWQLYQSMVVTLEDVSFADADGTTVFANGTAYELGDENDSVNFRTSFFDVDYIGEIIPSGTMNVTGIPNYRAEGNFLTSRDLADLYTNISADLPVVSEKVVLKGNYPNPFNPSTTIAFYLPTDSNIDLSIYNTKGQLVRKLHSGLTTAGNHQIEWNGMDNNGNNSSSGVYFYRLVTGEETISRKALLLK